jgi:hypothetical protein
MGMDMHCLDKKRHSPLQKALLSKAYDAVRFLIKENPHRFVMSKINPNDFEENPSMKNLLEKEIDKYKFRFDFFISHGSYTV